MSIVNELIYSLNSISATKTLASNDRTFIKDNLDFLQDHATKSEKKLIKPIYNILSREKLSESDKELIVTNRKAIIKLIKKYENEFNDESNDEETECHKYNPSMITEVDSVMEDHRINIQDVLSQNLVMSQLNLNNLIAKTNDIYSINNCATLHYGFLTIQSNNVHLENMTRMQMELRKLEIDKEIRIKELETEVRLKELEIENIKLKRKKNNK